MVPKCGDALSTLNKKAEMLADDRVRRARAHAGADTFPSLLSENEQREWGPDHRQEGLPHLTPKRSHSASPFLVLRLEKASANTAVWLTLTDVFEDCNYKRIFLENRVYRDADVQLGSTCSECTFSGMHKRDTRKSP